MTDFTDYTQVRNILRSYTNNEERRKLLYEWTRQNIISYEIFSKLTYYI